MNHPRSGAGAVTTRRNSAILELTAAGAPQINTHELLPLHLAQDGTFSDLQKLYFSCTHMIPLWNLEF